MNAPIANDAASVSDNDGDIHDATILKTTHGQAIAIMKKEGVEIDPKEKMTALQLFLQVSSMTLYT